MNKQQLRERAEELGVSFDAEDTNRILESKIAEAEELKKNASNQSGGSIEDDSTEKNASNQSGGSFDEGTDDTVEAPTVDTTTQSGDTNGSKVEPADEGTAPAESSGQPKSPAGIITTSSFDTSEPVVPEEEEDEEPVASADDPDDEREKVIPAAEPATPEVDSDEVLVRYRGTANTYQISKFKFSKNEPFQVVPKEFADRLGEDHADLGLATKEDVEEFYNPSK